MLRSRDSTTDESSTVAKPRPRDEAADDLARVLACALCKSRITDGAARIEIGGRHVHSCENPHGYCYRVGCFASAGGLVATGEPTAEYTWFPGYAWQVQNCARCRHHLGWRYSSADGGFWGLILDHLVELPGPA
jgi:hypothetical protein